MPINTGIPESGVLTSKQAIRDNWAAIQAKIGPTPEDWSPYQQGETLCLNEAKTGIVPLGLLDSSIPIHFRNRKVRNAALFTVEVTASTSPTTDSHLGALIRCLNTSSTTLTFEPSSDPGLGCTDGFACVIWRQAPGAVTISSGSLANQHPNGHTKIVSGLAAIVFIDAINNKLYLSGATEA